MILKMSFGIRHFSQWEQQYSRATYPLPGLLSLLCALNYVIYYANFTAAGIIFCKNNRRQIVTPILSKIDILAGHLLHSEHIEFSSETVCSIFP